ncbi:hypothetical protein Syun_022759 [Stephania yunnanensis]|uniref:Uncharacterized protein n=1 Tax=Stephania yunnanensis TaxID=152371 RepID=A0AAP0FK31_9MAGN
MLGRSRSSSSPFRLFLSSLDNLLFLSSLVFLLRLDNLLFLSSLVFLSSLDKRRSTFIQNLLFLSSLDALVHPKSPPLALDRLQLPHRPTVSNSHRAFDRSPTASLPTPTRSTVDRRLSPRSSPHLQLPHRSPPLLTPIPLTAGCASHCRRRIRMSILVPRLTSQAVTAAPPPPVFNSLTSQAVTIRS